MADELKHILTDVTEKVEGKRYFRSYFEGLAFNTGAPLATPAAFERVLASYGKWMRITEIVVDYDSTVGVIVTLGILDGSGKNVWVGRQVTTHTSDRLEWPGRSWLLRTSAYGAPAYSLWLTVTGYGATDNVYIWIFGEVF